MDELKQIGKYELRDYLGGGMSHVYKAWDPIMNRTVVVKILTREATSDADSKTRFLREAQTAGGLAHDNIIRVYDYGEEEGRPYMVMEYLQGQDLKDAIESGAAGDITRRLEIARDTARSLEYIHGQEIIHRDIKPENVHLDQSGRVRLMDFGIAKRPELNLTRTGFTLGTPYYMAPEQVCGDTVTSAADIYAFGILMYELLSGAKPYTGEKIEQVFYKILNEPVNLAPLRALGTPESVCDLVARCTAKDPAQRPASMVEVRETLDAALSGSPPAAVRKVQEPRVSGPSPAEQPTELIPPRGTPSPAEVEAPAPLPKPPTRRWMIPALGVAAAIVVGIVAFVATRADTEITPDDVTTPLSNTLSTTTGDMVLIPAGPFLFGPDKQAVELGAYYMDVTEVTNGAWEMFCKATKRDLPPEFPATQPQLPVVNITIDEARAFAQWAGKRLPNAREWEKPARGEDGRPYPWGAEPEPSRANVRDNNEQSGIIPANAFASGASPYGVLQMAGNVWELIDQSVTPSDGALGAFRDLLTPPPTQDESWFQMRGGSYDDPLVPNATFEWASVPARYRAVNIGFRCVKHPE